MKPWAHYSHNPHQYPDQADYARQLREEINNTPMTALERETAFAGVQHQANEWFKEAVKPYNAINWERKAEFWADCRAELGYDKFLELTGIEILEAMAYDQGHAYGYSKIFSQLTELVEFLNKIVQHIRK